MTAFAREGIELLATLGIYEARVLPAAGRELGRWRQEAARIPDPVLRGAAIAALTEKSANVEATAVLATLAPRATRGAALRAGAALQIAVDYLDSLDEQAGPDALRDGLQLHSALPAALTPGAEPGDWYRHHPVADDGGYLGRLVLACQEAVASLPSGERVLPTARRAAIRCGEGQAHTHAAAEGDGSRLEGWARHQPAAQGFRWWEVAAGASSSVAAHALIALAGERDATESEAEAIDAAYFPAIGALTVLLDDLVDRDQDQATGDHNYMDYYESSEAAAARLETIARLARGSTARLRHRGRHSAILSGVVAFYLSDPGAEAPFAAAVKTRLLRSAGPVVRPLAALLRRRVAG